MNRALTLPLIGQKAAEPWGMTQTEVARLTLTMFAAFRLADIVSKNKGGLRRCGNKNLRRGHIEARPRHASRIKMLTSLF